MDFLSWVFFISLILTVGSLGVFAYHKYRDRDRVRSQAVVAGTCLVTAFYLFGILASIITIVSGLAKFFWKV